ncbi:MAG: dicarboxylate/amino acid:cation symporter [Oscillospiraceae bacterium]|nr:dicarboxylate/amino acid:cation symporter [Oscillospiraceae bacterium]
MENTKKKFKLGLLPKLGIGIAVGIALGLFASADITGIWALIGNVIMRIYATITHLFGQQLLVFLIPFIIMGFLIPGITQIGKNAGRMVGLVAAFAYAMTFAAGLIAYFMTDALSNLIVAGVSLEQLGYGVDAPEPFITLAIPPLMGVITALATSFIVGIFLTNMKGENTLKKVAFDFQNVMKQAITKIIIPVLPFHISGLFAIMAYQGEIAAAMGVFVRLFIMIIITDILFLFVLYAIGGGLYKANPFSLMRKMIPTYLTALGTQSSLATMPINYINVRAIGVNAKVTDFIVPFGATILLAGSTMSIVSCAVIVMVLFGMEVSLVTFLPFIFMLGIMMVAAPGVPGGAIMAALGAIEVSLGFSGEMMAIMMVLYFAQDSLGTAVNITSDGAVALYLNRILGHKKLTPMTHKEAEAQFTQSEAMKEAMAAEEGFANANAEEAVQAAKADV